MQNRGSMPWRSAPSSRDAHAAISLVLPVAPRVAGAVCRLRAEGTISLSLLLIMQVVGLVIPGVNRAAGHSQWEYLRAPAAASVYRDSSSPCRYSEMPQLAC